MPVSRQRALIELREYSRALATNKPISTAWDFVVKGLKVWTGVPLPESKELSTLMQNRTLPPIVDMQKARARAVETWKTLPSSSSPLLRDGAQLANRKIKWMPLLPSMRFGIDRFTFGTAGELRAALADVEQMLDDGER
jgi:hypothetical protein